MPAKPLLLIIRDGWGHNPNADEAEHNAVHLAETPISDHLSEAFPKTYLNASGLDVGLPEGVIGNSEVGHQNIGAGRIVNQEIVRISKSIESGEIHSNKTLQEAFSHVKSNEKSLHCLGLCSSAGVHSILPHFYGLLEEAKQAGVTQVFLHMITDGRDSPPQSALEYLGEIEAKFEALGIGKIATLCGRYYAMDRDQRWERTQLAYDCLTGHAAQAKFESAQAALEHHYANPPAPTQSGDEFLPPCHLSSVQDGFIQEGDAVIFFNFRGDRPRQISRAFIDDDFDGFERALRPKTHYVTLTAYQEGLCPRVLFPKPAKMVGTLGEILSQHGLTQLRCAETEKYAHVTFFFNDYREDPFNGEDRILIPSNREVPTYDQVPEMSAPGITDAVEKAILSQKYDFILVNYANPDMVGHTGDLKATIQAVEAVDQSIGRLLKALDSVGGQAMITADHGNADLMWDAQSDNKHTQHTLNLVECVLYNQALGSVELASEGRLADIAPTILDLLNIEQPSEMTGASLLQNSHTEA